MESKSDIGLSKVLSAANGPARLARRMGGEITSQAISQWRRVPAERVLAVSLATGVPCHEIRPDLYPQPSSPSEAVQSSPQNPEKVGAVS